MSAIFPFIKIDSDAPLNKRFLPYQVAWILAEDKLHAEKKQAFALAEKSVRIGWTYADAFKNVRKRLRFSNRDYLFATKDYPSALEYMRVAKEFVDLFNLTRAMISHGEDYLKLPGPGRTPGPGRSPYGVPASAGTITEEIKIGYIKFDNGSRIIAFSAHPQAMAVYGGDVGLDEFAKHPNAELLWQTAQGRVTWAYDLAVWSSHEGDDTLFNQFAQQARLSLLNPNRNLNHNPSLSSSSNPAPCSSRREEAQTSSSSSDSSHASRITHHEPSHASRITHHDPSSIENQKSKIKNLSPSSPWNLYFRVTITDAIQLGLLSLINRTRGSNLTPGQFLADCRARAGLEQIFQQSYMCNPVPGGASIVDWAAIERCRSDYQIERLHLESTDILRLFGDFNPSTQFSRQSRIEQFLQDNFPHLLSSSSSSSSSNPSPHASRITHHASPITTPLLQSKFKIQNSKIPPPFV